MRTNIPPRTMKRAGPPRHERENLIIPESPSQLFLRPFCTESPFLLWPPHYQFSQNLSIKLRNVGLKLSVHPYKRKSHKYKKERQGHLSQHV